MHPTRPDSPRPPHSQPADAARDDAHEAQQAKQPEQPDQAARQRIQLRPKQQRRDRNQVTPFGEVLTDFMGRQRPIWTTGKVGQRLGIRRQTVANWIYHDITPPIEVMLEVLAKLNIPVSRLIEAYARRGIPVPILAPPEELEELAALYSKGQEQQTQPATQPRAPTPEETAKAWDDMIAQTRAVMLATGFPEQALDALLASLRRRESPTAFDRHLASEHAPVNPPDQTPRSTLPGGAQGTPGTSGTSGTQGPHGAQGPQLPLRINERE